MIVCSFLLAIIQFLIELSAVTGRLVRDTVVPTILRLRSKLHLKLPDVLSMSGNLLDGGDLAASDAYFRNSSHK